MFVSNKLKIYTQWEKYVLQYAGTFSFKFFRKCVFIAGRKGFEFG